MNETRYEMNLRARIDDTRVSARTIAAALGEGWTVEDCPASWAPACKLIFRDVGAVLLTAQYRTTDTRYVVRGWYGDPVDVAEWVQGAPREITVSAIRTSTEIARDILTRLWLRVVEATDRAKRRKAEGIGLGRET